MTSYPKRPICSNSKNQRYAPLWRSNSSRTMGLCDGVTEKKAGVHETLKKVQALYERMIGCAERAEQAAERIKRTVDQVEEFKQQVAGLVQTVDKTAQIHEARLKEAYRHLESSVNQETRMAFWFSRTWIYLLTLVCAGFVAITLSRMAEAFTVWVDRALSSWWAGFWSKLLTRT